MPRSAPKDAFEKFQRFRNKRRAAGLKLARIWVLDPRSPEMQARARHEAELLRGAPEEAEVLDFVEALLRESSWEE